MKDYKPSLNDAGGTKFSAKKRSHFEVLIQAIDLLGHHLFGFFILIIFTSILLSLPLTLTYLLQSVGSISKSLNQNAQMSVYLTPGLKNVATNELITTIKTRSDTEFVRYISPEQGLEQFEKQSGIAKLNDYINTNPIPGVIMLKVTLFEPSIDELDQLTEELATLPGVESVTLNGQWLTHAISVIASISTSIAIATTLAFFLILLVIIGLLNFLLPESLDHTSNLTMIYLGILLGIITGIAADYWVGYFARLLDQLTSQLTFLNLKPDYFHLAGWDIFINQFGCWMTLIIAALIVRRYHRHLNKKL